MRQSVLAFGSSLLLASCAHTQPPGPSPSPSVPEQSVNVATAPVTETLLALSHEWVDTWNQKDVERMTQLHGDIAHTIYGIGDTFSSVEWLLREIREKNFWNLSWKLVMV